MNSIARKLSLARADSNSISTSASDEVLVARLSKACFVVSVDAGIAAALDESLASHTHRGLPMFAGRMLDAASTVTLRKLVEYLSHHAEMHNGEISTVKVSPCVWIGGAMRGFDWFLTGPSDDYFKLFARRGSMEDMEQSEICLDNENVRLQMKIVALTVKLKHREVMAKKHHRRVSMPFQGGILPRDMTSDGLMELQHWTRTLLHRYENTPLLLLSSDGLITFCNAGFVDLCCFPFDPKHTNVSIDCLLSTSSTVAVRHAIAQVSQQTQAVPVLCEWNEQHMVAENAHLNFDWFLRKEMNVFVLFARMSVQKDATLSASTQSKLAGEETEEEANRTSSENASKFVLARSEEVAQKVYLAQKACIESFHSRIERLRVKLSAMELLGMNLP